MQDMTKDKEHHWFVYMLRCNDNTFYTGITTNLQRRLNEHNSSTSTTRYTRARQPVTLVYTEPAKDRSTAASREYQIKKMPRKEKEQLLSTVGKTNSSIYASQINYTLVSAVRLDYTKA